MRNCLVPGRFTDIETILIDYSQSEREVPVPNPSSRLIEIDRIPVDCRGSSRLSARFDIGNHHVTRKRRNHSTRRL